MKKTNKKFIIIFLVVLLLGLAVGYASFADVLNISGTAELKGDFNLVFYDCSANASSVGYTDTIPDASKITNNGKTLTIGTELKYPGAGVQYDVVIKNEGSIPAKVDEDNPIRIVSGDQLEGNAVITINGLTAPGDHVGTIAPGGTCEFSFTIEWPANMTDATLVNANKTYNYSFEINYVQDTGDAFSGAASHDDVNGN